MYRHLSTWPKYWGWSMYLAIQAPLSGPKSTNPPLMHSWEVSHFFSWMKLAGGYTIYLVRWDYMSCNVIQRWKFCSKTILKTRYFALHRWTWKFWIYKCKKWHIWFVQFSRLKWLSKASIIKFSSVGQIWKVSIQIDLFGLFNNFFVIQNSVALLD